MTRVITINRTVSDWVAQTRHLSVEDRGAYQEICDQIVLLGQDADPPSLPDEDAMFANLLGWPVSKWRRTKQRLCTGPLAVLVAADSRVSQARVVEEIEAAKERIDGASRAGRASGEARRRKSEALRERMLDGRLNAGSTDVATDSERIANADPNGTRTSHESRVTSHKEEESKDSRPTKKPSSDVPRFSDDAPEMKAARSLFERIVANNPAAKEPNWQAWASDVDRIIRIDKRTPDDVAKLINWSQQDSFWLKNILSPAALRKHFDRLTLQMRGRDSTPKVNSGEYRSHPRSLPFESEDEL